MRGMDATTGRALSGIDHLKQSVRDILTTPIGSRVMRRDYGSRLFDLIDNPGNPETVADIVAESAQALKKWEKRIEVSRVLVTSAQPGSVTLTIEGKYKPNGEPITLEGIEVK
ncbi:phage baseplate protein [Vibrio chagasii]|uniref:Phage baseplate protein n=2 Tax=Gammaproteobacteria TaxID=1236 RepID=A0A7V7NR79_9VIBR|nr:GPW/gp25 family protein [Vibrio chagasii]KAB0476528.1 phage baseplate protein [Vibrio chagasii]KAB7487865.1 phage baseplate protein [Klebsiella michiganensis]HCG8352159.1 GPW/gp25 family protein [Vibrio parahaemolyticus]